jgi:hypothetical protein
MIKDALYEFGYNLAVLSTKIQFFKPVIGIFGEKMTNSYQEYMEILCKYIDKQVSKNIGEIARHARGKSISKGYKTAKQK